MQVSKVRLKNFRNYRQVDFDLASGKTILIGENAQGKSNFLEAVEFAAQGKSNRTQQEADLITWGESQMHLTIAFKREGFMESVDITLSAGQRNKSMRTSVEKRIQINGVTQNSVKSLVGRLTCVSFTSQDLNLLRGGPSFRRSWIDDILVRLKPTFHTHLSRYQKVVSQRNRLLKMLFEKGRLTVSDQDQLLSWDKQLAMYGSHIVKERLALLERILPLAEDYQKVLSGQREILQANYQFQAGSCVQEHRLEEEDYATDDIPVKAVDYKELLKEEEQALAASMTRLLKQQRAAEIGRKQTLIGPHRDDISFCINGTDAASFASQGQQRSLVLSLKLSELSLLSESLAEPPVLLLDDVLAELDLRRQELLMSSLATDSQTIITTTHIAKFEPAWLDGAHIFSVKQGLLTKLSEELPTYYAHNGSL